MNLFGLFLVLVSVYFILDRISYRKGTSMGVFVRKGDLPEYDNPLAPYAEHTGAWDYGDYKFFFPLRENWFAGYVLRSALREANVPFLTVEEWEERRYKEKTT